MSTQTAAHDSRIGPPGYLGVGIVAALLALLVVPVLTMIGYVVFVPGLLLSVVVPALFGLVGIACGVQLYRLDRTIWGIALGAVTVVCTLIGTGFGLFAVF